MRMKLSSLLSLWCLLAMPGVGSTQAAGGMNPGVPGGHEPTEDLRTQGSLSQSELKHLTEQLDQWNRADGKAGVPPRVAKARTTAMLSVLNVSCVVADAAYRGTAPDDARQNIYEAACEDGMGYLIFLQKASLLGVSCLATGQDESQVKCALPANADGRTVAGTLLNRNHIPCDVKGVKWLGASAAHLDHVEVACEGGVGYVVRSPQPGSTGTFDILNCRDAGKLGIACELTANAPGASPADAESRPTLAWFKEALGRNGVTCQTLRARIIGRESIKRRYLVEFECSDRPEGLVAFVPAAGDTANSFESMDCASAVQRGVHCKLLASGGSKPPR